jgi:WD40 repeat protein
MTNEEIEQKISGKHSEVASMTLGLMNKPVMPKKNQRIDDEELGGTTVVDFDPDVLTNQKGVDDEIVIEDTDNDIMLTEEFLMNRTRWPERNKMYGHAYELNCIAVTKKGDYIVTAAKSKKKKYSNIFVWAIDSLNPICQLPAHEFTVHQIEFSPDDQYFLCVSRDRQFSVFQRNDDEKEPFKLVQIQKQAHKRILWTCSWAHNSKYFATGSREKTHSLKFWDHSQEENKWIEHS